MILEALTEFYEDLRQTDSIAPPGWKAAKISYGLEVNETGELEAVVCLLEEKDTGKKVVQVPAELRLPAMLGTRTSGLDPFFLWDNSKYLLGIEANNNKKEEAVHAVTQKSLERFHAAKRFHQELLGDIDTPMAHAICNFFELWDPDKAGEHPALTPYLEKIAGGANLVFMNNGVVASEDLSVCDAWQKHYAKTGGKIGQCLVTGKDDVIIAVHPSISGVKGAQATGAALVSFNAPAFCSYGQSQSYNAPVGKYATFAYTSALNYLLSHHEHRRMIGDTTVVFWAKDQDATAQEFVGATLFGDAPKEPMDYAGIEKAMYCLSKGEPFDEYSLDPDKEFYVLGLAPNAARISVRFFYKNTLGHLIKHVAEHHKRMEIQRPVFDTNETVPLWKLLLATADPNNSNNPLDSPMAGALTRAIMEGTNYPAALLARTMIRIRAEKNVTRERAAIIKAYYLKNKSNQCPEEVLTVSLNENSNCIPYVLGRLFSLYEEIQDRANPDLNATIKDKFFNGAQASPATVFPYLGKLCQYHLRKLGSMNRGDAIYFSRRLVDLKARLGEEYPQHLSLAEQGAFDLGYYHQTQKRYTPKNANNDIKEEN